MDLDPNYDPSDFLQMPSKKEPTINVEYSNIKKEPQSQPPIYEQDSSFSMSEMLMYEKRPTKLEPGQTPSESSEHTIQSHGLDFSSHEAYQSQEAQSPQPNAPQNVSLDDVGIHDDLAISDSDEEQQPEGGGDGADDSTKNQSENPNDNDADLWF